MRSDVASSWRDPTEEIVEFVVRAYPNPGDSIAVTFTDGAVLLVYADRPDMVITTKFLESERRMVRVLCEKSISTSRGQAVGLA